MIAARFLSQSLFCGLMAVAGSGCGVYASMPVEGSFDRTLAVNGPVDLEIQVRLGRHCASMPARRYRPCSRAHPGQSMAQQRHRSARAADRGEPPNRTERQHDSDRA